VNHTPRRRVAVIGCGAIAQSHLRYLHASPLVDLVALVDLAPVVTGHLAQMLGPGVRAFDDAATMLDEVRPDTVHVLTPPSSHVPLSTLALQAGADVLCEKPLAATAPEVDALLAVAGGAGRQVMECQNYRYLPEMAWLRGVVADGRLGRLRQVDIDVRVPIASGGRFVDDGVPHYVSHLPGGAVRDFLPHMVYLAEDVLPLLPGEVVSARWDLVSGKAAMGSDTLTAVLAGDDVTVLLRFSALGSPPGFRVAVVGEQGSVSVDLFHRKRSLETRSVGGPLAAVVDRLSTARQAVVDAAQEVRGKVLHAGENGIPELLDDMYRRLAAGEPMPVSPSQLRRTAEVVDLLIAHGGLVSSDATHAAVAS
jgi:predicted dehydrogenase